MRFLVIDDNATPADLCEAIWNLREKQRRSVIPSTYAEIGADIDELLEQLLAQLPETPGRPAVVSALGTPAAGHDCGAGRDVAGSSGTTDMSKTTGEVV